MTVILILRLVTVVWVAIAVGLSKIVTRSISSATWRVPAAVLIFAALLPLPLLDEIVGGRQFERLCQENSTIQVDRATAVGKTVYPARTPDAEVNGSWVRVVVQPRRFVDSATGETVVSYNGLVASGGRLIQALRISEGGMPLTFKGSCKPGDLYTLEKLFNELKITLTSRP